MKSVTKNILHSLEALRSAEIGHGHLSSGNLLYDPVRQILQLSGAGMKQLVKKASELGFSIIGRVRDTLD